MAGKLETIEALLQDDHCLIHINPAFPGVQLPESLKAQPTTTLKLSYYFAGRLAVLEDRVEAELRFQGIMHTCIVPWGAVWASTNVNGFHTTWDSDAPHPSLPLLLKKDQPSDFVVEVTADKQTPKKAKKEKARPDFLKRVK